MCSSDLGGLLALGVGAGAADLAHGFQKTQKTKTPAKEKRHQLVVKLLLFLDALGLFLWRTIALYITALKF